MASSVKDGELLMYKGHPLMRKENIIYYGSMEDRYIIMMQILETKRKAIWRSRPKLQFSSSRPARPSA